MNDKDLSNEVATQHIAYLGGLLVESIENFQKDILFNCKSAHEVIGRPSYVRMIGLKDKFEQAALLAGQ
jgi:hypothetical protein